MAEQLKPLAGERQVGESDKAVQACNDWLRLGAGRSLPDILSKYTATNRPKPPTTALQTLKDWSMKFNWSERATAYDATWEERKNEARRAVFNDGLALDYERIRKLALLADLLERQIYALDDDGKLFNVWLQDVKGIGSRDNFERVDFERFNHPLIEQFRKTLEDIAAEVGGRVKKHEHTGEDGEPLQVIIKYADDTA